MYRIFENIRGEKFLMIANFDSFGLSINSMFYFTIVLEKCKPFETLHDWK